MITATAIRKHIFLRCEIWKKKKKNHFNCKVLKHICSQVLLVSHSYSFLYLLLRAKGCHWGEWSPAFSSSSPALATPVLHDTFFHLPLLYNLMLSNLSHVYPEDVGSMFLQKIGTH
jgi:hypothetical protein